MSPVVSSLARHFPAVILWIVLGSVVSLIAGNALILALLGLAALTYLIALALERARLRGGERSAAGHVLLAVVGGYLLVFAVASLVRPFPGVAPFVVGVVFCHAVAYLVDVHRGDADTRHPFHAALYLIQLPVIIAGPLSRYREFSAQLAAGTVKLGAFAYGVRRLVTGLIKAVLVGGTLAAAVDAIFAAEPARLSAGAAWLGAICFGLQVYVQFSGYGDVGIGVGRMIGLRYSENFRRPYTAGSIREFWRRWNVTLITWLRDYLHLPIAGQEEPTLRLYGNIIVGFCLVGLWHGSGWTFPVWGLYCGSWLAFEAVGLRARIERLPAAVRHGYVIIVVTVGWVLLRSAGVGHAVAMLKAMSGLNDRPVLMAGRFLDPWLWTAIVTGAFAAGPLVPSISRWRVSVDAATTSLLMMIAATGLFLWRGPSLVLRSIWPSHET
jgi:alginate O-acetyltransferase complex protein AlgI